MNLDLKKFHQIVTNLFALILASPLMLASPLPLPSHHREALIEKASIPWTPKDGFHWDSSPLTTSTPFGIYYGPLSAEAAETSLSALWHLRFMGCQVPPCISTNDPILETLFLVSPPPASSATAHSLGSFPLPLLQSFRSLPDKVIKELVFLLVTVFLSPYSPVRSLGDLITLDLSTSSFVLLPCEWRLRGPTPRGFGRSCSELLDGIPSHLHPFLLDHLDSPEILSRLDPHTPFFCPSRWRALLYWMRSLR